MAATAIASLISASVAPRLFRFCRVCTDAVLARDLRRHAERGAVKRSAASFSKQNRCASGTSLNEISWLRRSAVYLPAAMARTGIEAVRAPNFRLTLVQACYYDLVKIKLLIFINIRRQ
jgi:hypothetical protein